MRFQWRQCRVRPAPPMERVGGAPVRSSTMKSNLGQALTDEKTPAASPSLFLAFQEANTTGESRRGRDVRHLLVQGVKHYNARLTTSHPSGGQLAETASLQNDPDEEETEVEHRESGSIHPRNETDSVGNGNEHCLNSSPSETGEISPVNWVKGNGCTSRHTTDPEQHGRGTLNCVSLEKTKQKTESQGPDKPSWSILSSFFTRLGEKLRMYVGKGERSGEKSGELGKAEVAEPRPQQPGQQRQREFGRVFKTSERALMNRKQRELRHKTRTSPSSSSKDLPLTYGGTKKRHSSFFSCLGAKLRKLVKEGERPGEKGGELEKTGVAELRPRHPGQQRLRGFRHDSDPRTLMDLNTVWTSPEGTLEAHNSSSSATAGAEPLRTTSTTRTHEHDLGTCETRQFQDVDAYAEFFPQNIQKCSNEVLEAPGRSGRGVHLDGLRSTLPSWAPPTRATASRRNLREIVCYLIRLEVRFYDVDYREFQEVDGNVYFLSRNIQNASNEVLEGLGGSGCAVHPEGLRSTLSSSAPSTRTTASRRRLLETVYYLIRLDVRFYFVEYREFEEVDCTSEIFSRNTPSGSNEVIEGLGGPGSDVHPEGLRSTLSSSSLSRQRYFRRVSAPCSLMDLGTLQMSSRCTVEAHHSSNSAGAVAVSFRTASTTRAHELDFCTGSRQRYFRPFSCLHLATDLGTLYRSPRRALEAHNSSSSAAAGAEPLRTTSTTRTHEHDLGICETRHFQDVDAYAEFFPQNIQKCSNEVLEAPGRSGRGVHLDGLRSTLSSWAPPTRTTAWRRILRKVVYFLIRLKVRFYDTGYREFQEVDGNVYFLSRNIQNTSSEVLEGLGGSGCAVHPEGLRSTLSSWAPPTRTTASRRILRKVVYYLIRLEVRFYDAEHREFEEIDGTSEFFSRNLQNGSNEVLEGLSVSGRDAYSEGLRSTLSSRASSNRATARRRNLRETVYYLIRLEVRFYDAEHREFEEVDGNADFLSRNIQNDSSEVLKGLGGPGRDVHSEGLRSTLLCSSSSRQRDFRRVPAPCSPMDLDTLYTSPGRTLEAHNSSSSAAAVAEPFRASSTTRTHEVDFGTGEVLEALGHSGRKVHSYCLRPALYSSTGSRQRYFRPLYCLHLPINLGTLHASSGGALESHNSSSSAVAGAEPLRATSRTKPRKLDVGTDDFREFEDVDANVQFFSEDIQNGFNEVLEGLDGSRRDVHSECLRSTLPSSTPSTRTTLSGQDTPKTQHSHLSDVPQNRTLPQLSLPSSGCHKPTGGSATARRRNRGEASQRSSAGAAALEDQLQTKNKPSSSFSRRKRLSESCRSKLQALPLLSRAVKAAHPLATASNTDSCASIDGAKTETNKAPTSPSPTSKDLPSTYSGTRQRLSSFFSRLGVKIRKHVKKGERSGEESGELGKTGVAEPGPQQPRQQRQSYFRPDSDPCTLMDLYLMDIAPKCSRSPQFVKQCCRRCGASQDDVDSGAGHGK